MEKAGFPSLTTVANFLLKRELPESAVIVVDEAGQIGGHQMLELIRLMHERHGRLVLSGDTRQHGAVEASDALLAIERHAGVKPVELHKIRRQDPTLGRDEAERKRIRSYRQAVEAAAAGKLGDSFERLDKMGAIIACGVGEHLNRRVPKLSTASEDSVSFDDGITKKLSQLMNFLPRVDTVALQPLGERSPMRFAAVAQICRCLPLQRRIDHEAVLPRFFETVQFFHQWRGNIHSAA